MRTAARSLEIADLAVRWRDRGVVGFDIAGAEAGYPPTRHLDAFEHVRRENFHLTIHAGEAFGVPSIWEALQLCGAERLGHGVRIVDDIEAGPGDEVRLGRVAHLVRDRRVPWSSVPPPTCIPARLKSIEEHPIGRLMDLRFRVTVNTDNRLMSATSLSQEFLQLVEAFEIGWGQIGRLTTNAMKSAFIPFDERLDLLDRVIWPAYTELRTRDRRHARDPGGRRLGRVVPSRPHRAAVQRRGERGPASHRGGPADPHDRRADEAQATMSSSSFPAVGRSSGRCSERTSASAGYRCPTKRRRRKPPVTSGARSRRSRRPRPGRSSPTRHSRTRRSSRSAPGPTASTSTSIPRISSGSSMPTWRT